MYSFLIFISTLVYIDVIVWWINTEKFAFSNLSWYQSLFRNPKSNPIIFSSTPPSRIWSFIALSWISFVDLCSCRPRASLLSLDLSRRPLLVLTSLDLSHCPLSTREHTSSDPCLWSTPPTQIATSFRSRCTLFNWISIVLWSRCPPPIRSCVVQIVHPLSLLKIRCTLSL